MGQAVLLTRQYNLANALQAQAEKRPDAPALVIGDRTLGYGTLAREAACLAGLLGTRRHSGRVGILGTRSIEAYVGILGTCWAGAAYVPLNLKWPPERLVALMRLLELDALVADENGAALLCADVLAAAPDLVVVPDGTAPAPAPARQGQHVVERGSLPEGPLLPPAPLAADALAYILFTSGTTGLPKGVMISAGSLHHYLAQTRGWTGYGPEDRIAEACDVTFDLSVHNLFLSLEAGAALHVLSPLDMLAPARFIRSRSITAWMSVPTLIGLMRRSGALKPGVLPTLRLSIFCGEPLPVDAVQAWAAAAPNSVVENIYGPTECTVVCMRQTLTDPPVVTEGRGILAIGRPYETMRVAILDDAQRTVAPGQPGEIALCGPQVGIGYFGQLGQTADRFRMIGGERWYLTGDLGRVDEAGTYHHLGRVDNQVKVKGNRIELEEVDAHLRRASASELVATIAWPVVYGSAEGLVAFVAGSSRGVDDIRAAMLETLPRYMVPERIVALETIPQNINGKIDRRALAGLLEAEAAPAAGMPVA